MAYKCLKSISWELEVESPRMDLGTNLCGKTNHAILTHIYELYQTTCEKPITNTEKTSSLN